MHASDGAGDARKRFSKDRLGGVDLHLGNHLVRVEAEGIEGESGSATVAICNGAAAS